ncbi:MAG: hypothetical protein V1822_00840, partial [Candidatus Micrarchaeota archaeon]
SLALGAAILCFNYLIAPSILDKWAIDYAGFLAYSFYAIILLGIIDGYLRASALKQYLIAGQAEIKIKKKSFIPLGWYNRTVSAPYASIKNVIISQKPIDIGRNEAFFQRFSKKFSHSFLHSKKLLPEEDILYVTILQAPDGDAFDFGIFDFHADISSYNNPIAKSGAAELIEQIRQKANLKLVFNAGE